MKAVVGIAALTGGLFAVSDDGELVIQEPFKSQILDRFTRYAGIGVEADFLAVNLKTLCINLGNATVTSPPSYNPQSVTDTVHSDSVRYRLSLERAELKFSLVHFLLGNGWIRQMTAQRVRGDVDQRFVTAREDSSRVTRNIPKRNDFYLDQGFHVSDLAVQVLYPDSSASYNLFVERCSCPLLRKRWLLYDFLSSQTTLWGTIENRFPLKLENGLLSIDKLPLRYLKPTSLPIDSPHDPLSRLIDSSVDVRCKVQDNLNRSKKFLIDLQFNHNQFRSDLSLFSISVPSFVRFLNETKPSFKINAQFDIPLEKFHCAWNVREAGIQNELMHHSFHYFNSYINSRTTQLEWLARFSYWSLNNAFMLRKERTLAH